MGDQRVPLSGESKQDVLLVLKHLYKDDPAIHSVKEARVLATFAHKYNMTRLRDLNESYLVDELFITDANAFDWAELAERIELRLLLAHCERYIILSFHNMPSSHKKVSKLSQSSILRIMDGLTGRGISSRRSPCADAFKVLRRCNHSG